ncbi:MAG: RNase P subunit p30 family protein [Candidatus Micrarchaeota archaeon]
MKFEFKDYGEMGFAGIGISGKNVEEVSETGSRAAQKSKNRIPILTSNNIEFLKKAARSHEFRVFHQPNFTPDVGLLRSMAQNRKIFEIPVNALLLSSGVERAILISKMRAFLKFCLKHRVEFALTTRANNEFETKTPGELISIGEVLGLSRDQAVRALSVVPESVLRKA